MKRPRRSALEAWAPLSILVALSACGGSGEAGDQPAEMSTLAYVVTECHTDAPDGTGGGPIRQRLQIRRGDQAPITVVEASAVPEDGRYCSYVGTIRAGWLFDQYGVFHRLGVTPDGSQVVFEVTDDQAPTVFPANSLSAEQEGVFVVRADGTGLRRLGPASRAPASSRPFFVFSPNGRAIAYIDVGPSRDNQDAVQIFTLDLATGVRSQVTHLPPTVPDGTYGPLFTDDQTIALLTYANADGLNPDGELISVSVKTNDGSLTVAQPPVAIPGSEVLTAFRITGSEVNVALLPVPGQAANGPFINEVFVIDGDNVLQLTDFGRYDTFNPTLSADGQRVIFSASADALGTNPTQNCQIFSIDRHGGDLRQLTDFHQGPESQLSLSGCFIEDPATPGCGANSTSRDTQSDAVVFYSSCDPFGTNPYGVELFAMRTDGTDLHQLTETQGRTRDASGALTVELPFPFAYPGMAIVYNIDVPRTPGPVATPTPGPVATPTPVDPRAVVLSPVFAAPGVPLGIEWPDLPDLTGFLDLGDGNSVGPEVTQHVYAESDGIFAVHATVESTGGALETTGAVARTRTRALAPLMAFTLTMPADEVSQGIVRSVAPAVYWAATDDRLAFASDAAGMARFGFDQVTIAPIVAGSDGTFTSDPPDFRLELTRPEMGTASGLFVRVSGARWTGKRAGTSFVSPMVLEGQFNVQDLIHAAEVLGGLDKQGATILMAVSFHLDPMNLPDTVPFAGEFAIIPAD